MLQVHRIRRWLLLAAAVVPVPVFATACEDDVVVPEPDVATFRIILPSLNDTVLVDVQSGQVTSGPITIAATTAFTAQFLRANGQPETLVTEQSFRLDVASDNAGVVTFTRTGAFAGSLNKVTAGATSLTFSLFHLGEMHNEFDLDVAITVN